MRQITALLMVGTVLLAAGCNGWINRRDSVASTAPTADAPAPPVEQLVSYLNDCAGRLKSVQSNGMWLDCKQGKQPISLEANMVCEKPRNFRLMGVIAGQPEVDIGSNNDEFWYWIKHDDPPYLYHCGYDAMAKGNVRMPFPFQPDMVVAGLGMRPYDADVNKYELKVLPRTLELSENVVSAQGQTVRMVTIFNRTPVDPNKGAPQVTDFVLRDAKGQDICKATVLNVQVDQGTGAVVPRKVRLSWPAQQLELSMTLRTVIVNNVDPQRAEVLFSRRNLPYQSFDLARWAPDGASTGIQRTRGSMP